ncbi:MAG: cupin domain-containing protein [Chloroflexia bacterium]
MKYSPKPGADSRWLFGSFFLGGFECSTHLTREGLRLDVVSAMQHDTQAGEDYVLCRSAGICALREAARWPIIDRGGKYDLSGVQQMARMAHDMGLTLIWDLMHYGYPDDLDPFSEGFVRRFAAYVRAVAEVVREETDGPTYYTPINEISYNAWAGGHVGYLAPFAHERGGDLKRALVRASIAGADAIWSVDPEAVMVNVDPLIRVHPPADRPDRQEEADFFNEHIVHEAFDLLCGRLEPELGGTRKYLGVVGLNYYACNQWIVATQETPQRFISRDDPAWVPLHELLAEVQARYGGPLVIAETGGTGAERPGWINYLASEAQIAINQGVDLQGICLYPVMTSPDWEDTTAFFDGGLFDMLPQPDGSLRRVISVPAARGLREAQTVLDPLHLPIELLPTEPAPQPEPPLLVVNPLEHTHFKPDNFSYQTLLAGKEMVVELYCFGPGAGLPTHRHDAVEHLLTVLSGEAQVFVGTQSVTLREGETLLVAVGLPHGIANPSNERLVVQQVSAPKPWDARFAGPHPAGPGG